MKTITIEQALEADRKTQQQVDAMSARNHITDDYKLFLLHQAMWAVNAGAKVVRVVPGGNLTVAD